MIKSFALGVAALAAAAIPTTQAWWDNGHMLCGEVAAQLMAKEDVATIEKLLATWDADFPGTSTISTAAIWGDQIKCKANATFCQSPLQPSFSGMDKWHYINLPIYVNGAKWGGQEPDLSLFKDSFEGDLVDILEKSLSTFLTTKSKWTANFVIRNFIHTMTDLHQPMHTVGGVSATNPRGDAGGNAYRFKTPCDFANLHALWDAAGGLYSLGNWQVDMSNLTPEIKKNASELASWVPGIYDGLNYDQFKTLEYQAFVDKMGSAGKTPGNGIRYIVLETYSFAQNSAYQGLDLTYTGNTVPCPNQSYVEWAKFVSQLRIAMAGKRLAVFLTQFAKQIRFLGLDK